jgi:arsenate reductase|tara:strand:- start:1517 stop:2113 length:597 start_codon:yes stop_codon:yes gene_type:complete
MTLDSSIEHLLQLPIPEERRQILQVLVDYIQSKKEAKSPIRLNFICTHNSRRSQFSQIWAAVASHAFGIETTCLSGGVEVTAFNARAVNSLKRMGFGITSEEGGNPKYKVEYDLRADKLVMFSKLFNDKVNQFEKFASVMTCDHADENCPFIPGTEQRISVNYIDPKEFDGTEQEATKYDERSSQIASEMFYVFSKIN